MNKTERNIAIDRYRGMLVFIMILFQYFERFSCFGILSRFAYHTPSLGIEILPNFALADFVAPMFLPGNSHEYESFILQS